MSTVNEAQGPMASGELGRSAEYATPAPAELEKEVDEALGLQLISIRLPRRLIEDLKLIARTEGLGYQPLVRRVLLRFAEAEFRNRAHERLGSALNELVSEPECEVEEPIKLAAYG